MKREYSDAPLVGVGVVVWRDERVLLVQRGREPYSGQWSIPGGLIELGETVEAAARREIREECAVEIDTPMLLTTVDLVERDAAGRIHYHYVLIELTARWWSGTPTAGDDAAAVRWVGVDELEHLPMWAETRRVLQLAAQTMRP